MNLPCAKLYRIIGMDVAGDFTMDVWVDVLDVVDAGVGIEFTGADVVGVVGKGWAITITLYLVFTGTLVLLFISIILVLGFSG